MPGEDPATAALRECLEETGYRARAALSLGVVNPNPALFGNRLHAFYALDVELERAVQNTGTELTEVVLVPVAELEELLLAGEIDHALVAGTLWRYLRLHRAALMVDSVGRAGATEGRLVAALVSDLLLRRARGARAAQHRRLLARHPGDGERFRRDRRELAEHAQRVSRRLRDRSVLRRCALRPDRPQARRLHGPVDLPRHARSRSRSRARVGEMLALRFVQAIGGGFSTVICMATVRDVYPVEQLGRRFATVTMVLLIAPLVAPALGAAVLPLGWEMIFVFKAAYAALLARRLRGARARDASRPSRQPVAALGVPAVLRRRAAARRRAALADSLCDGHGLLGVVHDHLRDQLVVHLHAVLRRQPGALFGACLR